MINYIYSPVIKGKLNDLKALGKIPLSDRVMIKPLVEAMPMGKKTDVDKHLLTLTTYLVKHAPLGEMFLDFYGLRAGLKTSSGQDAVLAGFNIVKGLGRIVTPTYGFGRDDALWPHFNHLCKEFNQGFCFRLDLDDIEDALIAEDTWTHVFERSAEINLNPSQIDLVIDLRDIIDKDLDELHDLVLDFLSINPKHNEYRSIILVGSSALKTVSKIPKDNHMAIKRDELFVWAKLQRDLPETTNLIFGDYGVIHPDFSDQGPNKNMNAKIRYTSHGEITYYRGHGLLSPIKDYEQYHQLAYEVRDSTAYSGKAFSYGDSYIDDVATNSISPGTPATWVMADMNHHLTYTLKQLEVLTVKVKTIPDEAGIIAAIS